MKRIDVSPFEVQLFLEVADSLSFIQTAIVAGMTQPSVSRAIGRIEERLGARLFDRSSRHVALTPQGQAFLPIARRIVHDLTASLDELAQHIAGEIGHVTVAALPSAAAVMLPGAISSLRQAAPLATVQVIDSYLENVAEAVSVGAADFGIAVRPDPSLPLDFEVLREELFVAIVPEGHPLSRHGHVTWDDLRAHPFITMRSMTSVRQLTDTAFGSNRPEPAFEASHPATAGAMVAAGLGVSALPRMTMHLIAPKGICMLPLVEPKVMRQVGLVMRRNRSLSPLAERLASILRTLG